VNIDIDRRKFLAVSGCLSLELFLASCGGGGSGSSKTGKAAEPVVPAPVSLLPEIVIQPAGQTIFDGGFATLGVVAIGADLNYQWQQNDVDIPGATGDSHTTQPLGLADDGLVFTVIVANDEGSVISDQAIVMVRIKPVTADSLTINADSVFISVDEA